MAGAPESRPAEPRAVRVGIAVVEHAGRFLVGIRGPEGPLAGLAEFPGGKCLPDESPRDCARRECREETGLEVAPVALLRERTFDYPHGRVALHFWLCRLVHPEQAGTEHQGFRWLARNELDPARFPEANQALIESLARREEAPGGEDAELTAFPGT